MSLKEKIREDIKTAMKSGDTIKRDVLRFLENAILKEEIDKQKRVDGLSDEEVVAVVSRQIKQRKDSIEQFSIAGRTEMAEKEFRESQVLAAYLPDQMSEEEVRSLIAKAVASFGEVHASDSGKIMGKIMPQLKGRFPGERVKVLLQEVIGA